MDDANRNLIAWMLGILTVVVIGLGVGTALTVGAGGGGGQDLENGKQLFISSCGSCHTLADAGTEASIGPNLDDTFRASRQEGFEESQFEGVVIDWIARALPPMPRNIVVGADADDVAAYIASVAGQDDESEVRPAPDETEVVPRDPQEDLIDATPPEAGEGE